MTDLDSSPEMLDAQLELNAKGALMVIHAHGDNNPALRKYLPHIKGRVMGTTQTEPEGRLHNFGGFTDGDRAVTMASHFGAAEIALLGFNLTTPVWKEGVDPGTKKKKLRWAERIIAMADPQPYMLE